MDDAAWMHYRVERETEDVGRTEGPSAGAIAKEVAKTALFPRIPKFGPAKIAKDTVKIFNRSGEVVAALPFDSHSESDRTEQRVVDDLMNMSALEFRVKYGIAE